MTTKSSKGQPRPQPTGLLVLAGLEGYAHHGDLPEERRLGGHFSVDIELTTDTRRAARSDQLRDSVDYVQVEGLARRILERRRYKLLETLAERIAEAVARQPGVLAVRVRVTKRPPLPHLRAFTVEVSRPL